MKKPIGFIRVRKRKLSPPRTYWERPTASASYDIVRAVRVNGQPTHKFVLGLGSQPDNERANVWFWTDAIRRMTDVDRISLDTSAA